MTATRRFNPDSGQPALNKRLAVAGQHVRSEEVRRDHVGNSR